MKIGWIITTLVFLIIGCLVALYVFYQEDIPEDPQLEVNTSALSFCSRATKIPSWGNGNGDIIDVGFIESLNGAFIDLLIRDNIYFIYHSGCPACERQIESFGSKWEDYKQSGYTIDCSAALKGG